MDLLLQTLDVAVQGRDGARRVVTVRGELGKDFFYFPGHCGARVHLVVVVPCTCVPRGQSRHGFVTRSANHGPPLSRPIMHPLRGRLGALIITLIVFFNIPYIISTRVTIIIFAVKIAPRPPPAWQGLAGTHVYAFVTRQILDIRKSSPSSAVPVVIPLYRDMDKLFKESNLQTRNRLGKQV